jgi:hypothetical protein
MTFSIQTRREILKSRSTNRRGNAFRFKLNTKRPRSEQACITRDQSRLGPVGCPHFTLKRFDMQFDLGVRDIQTAGDLLFDLPSVSSLGTSNSRGVSFSTSAFVDPSSTAVMKQVGSYCSPIAMSLTALTSDLAGSDLCTNPATPAASASCEIWRVA